VKGLLARLIITSLFATGVMLLVPLLLWGLLVLGRMLR
jgi:hypothetical protein